MAIKASLITVMSGNILIPLSSVFLGVLVENDLSAENYITIL